MDTSGLDRLAMAENHFNLQQAELMSHEGYETLRSIAHEELMWEELFLHYEYEEIRENES